MIRAKMAIINVISANHMSLRVAFITCDQMLLSSLTLPREMLQAAEDSSRSRRNSSGMQVDYLSANGGPLKTSCGMILHTSSLDDSTLYDLIYLPALWRNPRLALEKNQPIMPWLQRQHTNGAIIGAAGTGVCFLAQQGLLDERPASTHWFYLDRFSQLYPNVDLKRQHLITRAGNLYCAASINALADLTVHFINHFYGGNTAAHVERHFSHEARNSFEIVTYREETNKSHHDEDIIQMQLWLHQNFFKAFRLADVAKMFGMSVRNFNRRFLSATGKSPLSYLQDLRIDEARELLKNSNLCISEVAEKVGYQDTGHFTRIFKKSNGVTPQDFKKSVRRKLFSLE